MATRGPDPDVTDQELITAVSSVIQNTKGPVASTAEIADIVGLSVQRTRERLDRIEDIESKTVGDSGPRIYWPRRN